MRISICPFFGPCGLPVPYRTRLLYAVGRPIFPPSSVMEGIEGVGPEGDDVVEHVHAQVRTELYRIFEKYKSSYGWDRKSLEIVWLSYESLISQSYPPHLCRRKKWNFLRVLCKVPVRKILTVVLSIIWNCSDVIMNPLGRPIVRYWWNI